MDSPKPTWLGKAKESCKSTYLMCKVRIWMVLKEVALNASTDGFFPHIWDLANHHLQPAKFAQPSLSVLLWLRILTTSRLHTRPSQQVFTESSFSTFTIIKHHITGCHEREIPYTDWLAIKHRFIQSVESTYHIKLVKMTLVHSLVIRVTAMGQSGKSHGSRKRNYLSSELVALLGKPDPSTTYHLTLSYLDCS